VPAGGGHPLRPLLGVEPEGVDDGEQSALHPALHDQVEHVEGVGAGTLVAPSDADDGMKCV